MTAISSCSWAETLIRASYLEMDDTHTFDILSIFCLQPTEQLDKIIKAGDGSSYSWSVKH
jgi:hypothetical protein